MQILPRSLVDEAEGEIWSINQEGNYIFFFISHSNDLYTVGEWHEYCHQRAMVSAIHSLQNLFSGRFRFYLPHYDARIRVSIMTGFAQAKAHWRTREYKSLLFKISNVSDCLYRKSLLTSDFLYVGIGSSIHRSGLIVHDTRFVATKLRNFYEEIYRVDRETIQKATKLPCFVPTKLNQPFFM